MSRLKELKKKRMDILEQIVENQRLCKYLYYSDSDPLNKPYIENSFDKLFMDRLFPFPFTPNVQDSTGSILCVYFGNIKKSGVAFKDIEIKFIITCHYDSWLIDDANLRPDAICEEIEEIINYKNGFGLGKVLFEYRRPIYTAEKWAGYELCYRVNDFN